MNSNMILVKPISGSHDFYTYNIASQQLTENSLALSHSFTEDYGICYLTPSKLIISGGYNPSTGLIVGYTFIISLPSLEVVEVAPLPIKLKGIRLVSYESQAFSIGGCSEQDSEFLLEGFCFKYSLDSNT